MGYGINLYNKSRVAVARLYLSYNFAGLNEDYWNLKAQQGKKTSDVIPGLESAIKQLEDEGVEACIPKGCDGWSVRKEFYLVHLQDMLCDLKKSRNTVFSCDEAGDCDLSACDTLEDDEEEEEELPPFVIYARHPAKGNVEIRTLADAAEMYTYAVINENPHAGGWLDIAHRLMPGGNDDK
jgi:hypothetical protein